MKAVRKELIGEIIFAADYLAGLIRTLPDTSTPLKKSSWTVGTASAHLVISQKLSKKILQGEENPYKNANPESVAFTNEQLLRDFTERRGDKLATMLIMNTEAFLKETDNYNDDRVIQTHFGTMDLLTSLSYNLCHVLIHGSQIALALKKPLPLEEKHIALTLPFLKQAMLKTYDKMLAKDFQGTFVIHIRNLPPYAIVCRSKSITVDDTIPEKVDCHISVDPFTFFLIATGVIGQWMPLLQGKFVIWGRKPWLALRLTTLFKSP
jgi:hypothetical protein